MNHRGEPRKAKQTDKGLKTEQRVSEALVKGEVMTMWRVNGDAVNDEGEVIHWETVVVPGDDRDGAVDVKISAWIDFCTQYPNEDFSPVKGTWDARKIEEEG